MAEPLAVVGTVVAALQLLKYGAAIYEEFAQFSIGVSSSSRRVSSWDNRLRAFGYLTALLAGFDAAHNIAFRSMVASCQEEIASITLIITSLQKHSAHGRTRRLRNAWKIVCKEKELEARLGSLSCLLDKLNQCAVQSRLLGLTAAMSTVVTEMNNTNYTQQLTSIAGILDGADYQALCDSDTLAADVKLNTLALGLQKERLLSEAEKIHRLCLARRLRLLGPEDRITLQSKENLSIVLHEQGRIAEAEPLLRSTAQSYESTHGSNHPDTLRVYQNLTSTLRDLDRYAEAESFGTASALRMDKVLGRAHPQTLNAYRNLAIILQYQEKFVEALVFAKKVRDVVLQCTGYTSMYVGSESVVKHVIELEEHVNWVSVYGTP
ncbi:hypothetical protein BDV96DRAFT_639276 [Lophiotrema nucula]|uniref:Kinesin light chain n=1 Tax=Lophiotrema nucula TaxID=690887 RepID=A0A6A5ZT76_9PLEO|nr:hypothetical protein BDV96DRAFT_639276 [Lophiotrema nucula]